MKIEIGIIQILQTETQRPKFLFVAFVYKKAAI